MPVLPSSAISPLPPELGPLPPPPAPPPERRGAQGFPRAPRRPVHVSLAWREGGAPAAPGGRSLPSPPPPTSCSAPGPRPGSGELPAARPYGAACRLGSAGGIPVPLGCEGDGGCPPGSGDFLLRGRGRKAVPARGEGLAGPGAERHPPALACVCLRESEVLAGERITRFKKQQKNPKPKNPSTTQVIKIDQCLKVRAKPALAFRSLQASDLWDRGFIKRDLGFH